VEPQADAAVMILRVAAKVAANQAHFGGPGWTPPDVIMALTRSDVFLRIWTDIIKSLF
jgi:hypothetical protein